MTPLQGWSTHLHLNPGRCPGLTCLAPSGRGVFRIDFLRRNPSAFPVFWSLGRYAPVLPSGHVVRRRPIMRTHHKAGTASIVTGVLICAAADAGPLAPQRKDEWSKPVSSLAGRLRVAKTRISTDEYFQLTLELTNRGNMSLAVQCGNPHIFSITVIDTAGKQVGATSVRLDVLSSPQWGVIPGRSYLGFPVSMQSQDGAKGSHLDITTRIWKLSPGKYRITGQFSSGRAADFMGKPGKAKIWEGRIQLPPLDIEVVRKE